MQQNNATMPSTAQSRRLLLCFSLISLSFVCFFLNESPKNGVEPTVTEFRNPPSGVVSSLEVRGKYIPPASWTKFEGQQSDSEEQLESAILGVDAPITADKVDAADIDLNTVRNGIVDEEKLREKVVLEDAIWVSWQKMNQVRFLSLLIGTQREHSYCHVLAFYSSSMSCHC